MADPPLEPLVNIDRLVARLPKRNLTGAHRQQVKDGLDHNARNNFWEFRQLARPQIYLAWWQKLTAQYLLQFYRDFKHGRRPKLILMAPPQHGKSEQIRDFVAWLAGRNPDLRTIFASYSDELGMTTNLHLQRMFLSPVYQRVFYLTQVAQLGDRDIGRARRTSNVIEFVGKDGSFRNTTVQGQITGFGLDIGIIDDPIKGRSEAQSMAVRERTWSWFIDDFFSRFSQDAGLIMILTRWHVDDPAGRWLERWPDTKVVKFAAVAESEDEWTVKRGFRKVGGALFPEHKPIDFLMERKRLSTQASWLSLYQQSPIVVGGGIFPVEKVNVIPVWDWMNIKRSVRYWDKAGTADGGNYTAGTLMHMLQDGRFVISDVQRGQWSALDRENRIKHCAERDKALLRSGSYEVGVEQEPGSGGKESAENTIRNLAGFRVYADRVTGSKEARAEPLAAQVQGGNVYLVAGNWCRDFLAELEVFPQGKYRDQCDAASGAFNRIVTGSTYELDSAWLD